MRKLTLLLLLLLSVALKATNYTSVANGNWSSSSTWSPTGVPGSTDTVTIANTVTLDSNKSVFTITINSGKTLTVSGSNVLTVYGNFINNGTFTANTGIVYFNGTGAETLGGSTATTFYGLEQYGSGTVTLGNNITVSNNFILEAGTFDVSTSNYNLTLNGPYVYFYNTFTPRSGTITFSSSGTTFIENGSSAYVAYNNVVVNTSVYAYYGTQVIPVLTINSGKYMQADNAYLGNVTNNGTFFADYLVYFYGTGTVVSGSGVFNEGANGIYQFYGTPFTIGAGITFNCGIGLAVFATTYDIVMTNLGTITGGVVTNGGTSAKPCKIINGSTGSITTIGGTYLLNSFDTVDCSTPGNTLIYNNTSNTTLRSFLNNKLGNLTINPSSGTTVSLANNLTVGGNLTISTGTLDATTGNYNLTVGGNFTNNGTFTPRNGTVTFNGSANQSISGTGTISFYNLTQNQSSATDSLFIHKATTVSNNFTITQGKFDVTTSNYGLTIGGSFSNTGSFIPRSGTVTFNGGNDVGITNTGALSFYNLTENLIASTDTLLFNSPVTVSNTFTQTQGVLNCQSHLLTNSSVAAVTLSPSSSTICNGNTDTLRASGFSTYVWTPNTGLSATTGANVIASPTTNTTYTVYGSISSRNTCASGTDAVTVNNCGNTCGYAISISSTGSSNSTPISYSNTWFTFTAASNATNVLIHDPKDTLGGRIKRMVFYGGTCGSLDSIYGATFDDELSIDSLILCHVAGLTSGNTYYIKAIADSIKPTRNFIVSATAQNFSDNCSSTVTCDLINNGNFETTNSCPTGYSNIYAWPIGPNGNSDVSCWYSPPIGTTPDYFNTCNIGTLGTSCSVCVPTNSFGCASAHSGNGFAGIFATSVGRFGTLSREYLQENLLGTGMIAGTTYNVSFWAQLATGSPYSVDAASLGIYITNGQPTTYNASSTYGEIDDINTGNPINPTSPQLITASTSCSPAFNSSGWVHITGTYYSPSGGENWITIGNFSVLTTQSASTLTSCYYGGTISAGSSYYYIDDVSITPIVTIAASTTPSTICAGSSSTLTASGAGSGGTYTWSPSTGLTTTTGASVTASPTTTIVYTVTGVTSTGCTSTATVTVTVNPIPTVSISAGGSTSFCAGGSVGLTASGASTYTWSPSTSVSPSTGSSVTANPTNTVTYTVTGTSSGCNGTATITVDATPTCCSTTGAAYTFTNQNIPSGTYSTTSLIVITGTCTVNSGLVTFAGCPNVQMAAGAEIIVEPGTELNLTNAGANITRLYACGNMWYGIIVEPGSTFPGILNISGGSIVEDAIQAIYAPPTTGSDIPPIISVVNSELNNNYQDIYIAQYTSSYNTNLYPFTLQGSTLTTSTDGTYSGPKLKAPYGNQITNYGIHADSVQGAGIIIGTSASSSYTNTFRNMNYGVYGLNSNFQVYNNTFEYLNGKTIQTCFKCIPPPPIGEGIVAMANNYDHSNSATYYKVVVGGGSSYETNAFDTVFRGVDVTNYMKTSIYNNSFNNATDYSTMVYAPTIGDHAAYVKIADALVMEIDSNTVNNFRTGIEVDRTPPSHSSTHQEKVNYNTLTVSGTGIMNTGILVENTSLSLFAPTQISHNQVYDASNCIWIRNTTDIITLIDSNPDLRILKYSYPVNTVTERSGIRVEDCQGTVTVQDNHNIYTNNTYLSAPTEPYDTDVIGINIVHSTGIAEKCNVIYNVSECMRFTGNCVGQEVYGNEFSNTGAVYDGLVLWNNGIIGPQGSSGHTTGNKWSSGTGTFLRSMTYCEKTLTPGRYSPLWLSSSYPYYPTSTLNKTTGSIGIDDYNEATPWKALNTTSGSPPSCPIPVICTSCVVHFTPVLDAIAEDSISYVIDSTETQYTNQQYLYTDILEYDTLATDDSVLNSFYTANTSTNLGKLCKANAYLSGGLEEYARDILGSFTPANAIEQNYFTTDSIFVNTILSGVDTLDSLDFVHLYNIAYQCPDLGGMGVYQARAMLNLLTNSEWEFSDSCNTDTGRIGHKAIRPPNNNNTLTPLVNLNAKVYPNPANSLLNIEVNLPPSQVDEICMYNSLGEKVVCEELEQNVTTLPTNNLSQGIYYYRITDINGSLIKSDKVMILH